MYRRRNRPQAVDTIAPHRPHTKLHQARGIERIKEGVMPSRSALKKEALQILAQLDVPPEDSKGDMLDMAIGFLHAFKQIDKRKEGKLTRDDFYDTIRCLNPNETPEKFLALCDFNHDGVVTREEFIRAYVKLEITDQHYAAFAEIDTNQDGKISVDELQKAFAGSKYGEEKIAKWFKKADMNKSGFISYREFSKSPLERKYKKAKRALAEEAMKQRSGAEQQAQTDGIDANDEAKN